MSWQTVNEKDFVQKSLGDLLSGVRVAKENEVCKLTELVHHHHDAIGVSRKWATLL